MSNHKAASNQKVAVLAVGSVGAIGLAYWSISSALAPPPKPTSPPASAPSLPAGPSPAASGTSQPQADASPPAGQQAEAMKPTLTRASMNSEALLSPEADPFAPLVQRPPAPPASNRVSASSNPAAGGSMPVMSAVSALPTIAPLSADTRLPAPLLARPMGGPGTMPPAQSLSAQPAPAMAQPDLVGTLLGERPSAVFRMDKQLVLVPVGNMIAGWKVLSVDQGEATIKRAGQTERLVVGSGISMQMAQRPVASSSSSMLASGAQTSGVRSAAENPSSMASSVGEVASPSNNTEKHAAASAARAEKAYPAPGEYKPASSQTPSYFAQAPRSTDPAARPAHAQESRLRPTPWLAAPRPASLEEPGTALRLAESHPGDFQPRGNSHAAVAQPAMTLSSARHHLRRYRLHRHRRVRAHHRLYHHLAHRHHRVRRHRHPLYAWRTRHHFLHHHHRHH